MEERRALRHVGALVIAHGHAVASIALRIEPQEQCGVCRVLQLSLYRAKPRKRLHKERSAPLPSSELVSVRTWDMHFDWATCLDHIPIYHGLSVQVEPVHHLNLGGEPGLAVYRPRIRPQLFGVGPTRQSTHTHTHTHTTGSILLSICRYVEPCVLIWAPPVHILVEEACHTVAGGKQHVEVAAGVAWHDYR